MSNNYYTFTPRYTPGTKVRAEAANTQFDALVAAFDLLPSSSSALKTGKPTYAGATAGSGDAFTVTMPNTRLTNVAGDEVVFLANRSNTGAATLNVDGIGAVTLRKADGTALAAADITSGLIYVARYDATNTRFLLMSPSVSDTVGSAASAAAAAASAAAALVSENAAAVSAAAALVSELAAAASAASSVPVTLVGTGTYLTLAGQAITRLLIDLASATHVTGTLPIANGGSGQTTASAAFGALKQAATDAATGVVEKAVVGEVYAATADKFISADLIESASAAVALSDAATVALDWDAGIYRTLTITANRILGNPTNGQPGTWRTVRVQADTGTNRTLTFDTQYVNVVPTLTDIDSGQPYLLTIFCHTASVFYVYAAKAANF